MSNAAKLRVKMAQPPSATPQISQTFPNKCLEKGKKLYLKSNSADVHFLFGPMDNTAVRVPAHKAILAADSDVFEAMFYGDLKEPGDVHVPDSTETAFMEFLQYFYLTEVTLTADNVVAVLDLGTKYDVEKCVNDCVRFLMRTLDIENVCEHLDVAILYDKKPLMEVCEKRVVLDTVAVFNSSGFQKCGKRVLAHILKMTVLSCTEIDVFEACMTWVKAISGRAELSMELIESHLGELYYDIRLASLTIEQFCALHTRYESVLARDFTEITKMIVLPDFQASKFNKCQRKAAWNASAIIKCDRKPSSQSNFLDQFSDDDDDDAAADAGFDVSMLHEHEEITFSVNEPMLLGSLVCTQIFTADRHWSDDLQVVLEVIETTDLDDAANSKVLSTTKVQFKSDGGTDDVLLPHPILIRPDFYYMLRLGPFPPHHLYSTKILKSYVQLESKIYVEFHENCHLSLIAVLNFNKISAQEYTI